MFSVKESEHRDKNENIQQITLFMLCNVILYTKLGVILPSMEDHF